MKSFRKINMKNKYLKKALIVIAEVIVIFLLLYMNCTYDTNKIIINDKITVHADTCNITYFLEVLHKANSKLKNANIDIPSATFVLCNSQDEYNRKTLYTLRGSLATNITPFNFILLSSGNYQDDLQEKTDNRLVARSISSVIAHELAHSWQYSKLGVFMFFWAKFRCSWKLEGHAEYVAASSSFNVNEGIQLFMQTHPNPASILDNDIMNTTYWYYICRLRVSYLIDIKGISWQDFWETTYNEETLDLEIREYISKTGYNITQQ